MSSPAAARRRISVELTGIGGNSTGSRRPGGSWDASKGVAGDTGLARAAIEIVANNLNKPSQTVLDARGAPRFRGEVEPLDPVAGHIPGALNRPFTENFGADGKFKSPEALRAEFDKLLAGRDPKSVVQHCGSGVSAVPNVMAMAMAGLGSSALFAGSWSEWSHRADLPVAQG